MSMLTKDDTLTNSKESVERRKNLIFVFFIFTVHIELSDGINTEFFLLQLNIVCVWREFGSECADVVGECGGEEDNLDLITG